MCNKLTSLWLLLVLLVPFVAFGQELVIDNLYPLASPTSSLAQVIIADTADMVTGGNAAWVAGTRIYVLKRNAIYPWNRQIAIGSGRTLTIKCEAATAGYKPEVWGYDAYNTSGVSTGRPPGNFAQINGASTIDVKDVNFSGFQEDIPTEVWGVQGSIFATPTAGMVAGVRFLVDGCILKSTSGNHIRSDAQTIKISITNSMFTDLGECVTSNLGAGKVIDPRGLQIDTIIMNNNTFVNIQDRIIRRFNSTGELKNLWFNNNTIVNSMAYHGVLSLSLLNSAGGNCEIKNNLLIDPFSLGDDTCAVRQAEFTDSNEKDALGVVGKMTWIIAKPALSGTNLDIANNYYTVSDSGAYFFNALPDSSAATPLALGKVYTRSEGKPLTDTLSLRLTALGGNPATAFKKIAIQPVNAPKLMLEFMRWLFVKRQGPDTLAGGGGKGKAGNLDRFWLIHYDPVTQTYAKDYNRKSMQYYTDTLNLNFRANVSLTGVGDPRWSYIGPITSGSGVTSQALGAGWNLVSVPRYQVNTDPAVVYSQKAGSVFAFNTATKSYTTVTAVDNGPGYWVNNSVANPSYLISGAATSVPLVVNVAQASWALVGGRAWPVNIADLKLSGLTIAGSAFRFNATTKAYVATTVIPAGESVWINASAAGTVTIP